MFAERLKELREQAGLTQVALAKASGLSLGAIRNYEQGIREPYWNGLFQLAGALGVDCNVFADCVAKTAPQPPRAKGRPRNDATAKTLRKRQVKQ